MSTQWYSTLRSGDGSGNDEDNNQRKRRRNKGKRKNKRSIQSDSDSSTSVEDDRDDNNTRGVKPKDIEEERSDLSWEDGTRRKDQQSSGSSLEGDESPKLRPVTKKRKRVLDDSSTNDRSKEPKSPRNEKPTKAKYKDSESSKQTVKSEEEKSEPPSDVHRGVVKKKKVKRRRTVTNLEQRSSENSPKETDDEIQGSASHAKDTVRSTTHVKHKKKKKEKEKEKENITSPKQDSSTSDCPFEIDSSSCEGKETLPATTEKKRSPNPSPSPSSSSSPSPPPHPKTRHHKRPIVSINDDDDDDDDTSSDIKKNKKKKRITKEEKKRPIKPKESMDEDEDEDEDEEEKEEEIIALYTQENNDSDPFMVQEDIKRRLSETQNTGTVKYLFSFRLYFISCIRRVHNFIIKRQHFSGTRLSEAIDVPQGSVSFIELRGLRYSEEDLRSTLNKKYKKYIIDCKVTLPYIAKNGIGKIDFTDKQQYGGLIVADELSSKFSRVPTGFKGNSLRDCDFIFSQTLRTFKVFDILKEPISKRVMEQNLGTDDTDGFFTFPDELYNGSSFTTNSESFIKKTNDFGFTIKVAGSDLKFLREYANDNQVLLGFNIRVTPSVLSTIIKKIKCDNRLKGAILRTNSMDEVILHIAPNLQEKVIGGLKSLSINYNSQSIQLLDYKEYKQINLDDERVASNIDHWLKRDTSCWNKDYFLESYETVKKRKPDARKDSMLNILNARMMANTIMQIRNRCFWYNCDRVGINSNYTTEVKDYIHINYETKDMKPPRKEKPNVSFYRGDAIDKMIELTKKYKNVGIIVAASSNGPFSKQGRDYSNTEEELCRRTTLIAGLKPGEYSIKSNNSSPIHYPLAFDKPQIIVSRNISIIRNGLDKGGAFIQNPPTITVISVPIKANPEIDKKNDDYANIEDVTFMFKTLCSAFMTALFYGVDALVLSPIGIGAAKHPLNGIEEFLSFLILNYNTYFKEVVLCSFSDKIDEFKKKYNDNYKPNISHGIYPCKDMVSNQLCSKYMDEKHRKDKIHQYICPCVKDCKCSGKTHKYLYLHKKQLNELEEIKQKNAPMCPKGCFCTDFSEEHCKKYSHPELCTNEKCNRNGCNKRHKPKESCRDGLLCLHIDEEHYKKYEHSQGRLMGNLLDPDNSRTICEYNINCKYFKEYIDNGGRITSPELLEHMKMTVHLPKKKCKYGDKCKHITSVRPTEEDKKHILTFSHPDIKDFRPECKDGKTCTIFTKDHMNRFSHPLYADVYPTSNLNLPWNDVDFLSNVYSLLTPLRKNFTPSKSALEATMDLFKSLRPVHRMDAKKFESCLGLSYVMSRKNMDVCTNPDVIFQGSRNDPELMKLCNDNKDNGTNIMSYFELSLKNKGGSLMNGIPATLLKSVENVQAIVDKICERLIQHCKNLTNNKTGIGYPKDIILHTDESVFTIIGPNTREKYGKCALIFDREILYHPSAWFNFQAATYYLNVEMRIRKYIELQFFKDKDGNPNDRQNAEQYWHRVLNPGIPGAVECIAHDLLAQSYFEGKKQNPVVADVLNYLYYVAESHYCIEGHLPGRVPLTSLRAVLMYADEYSNLSPTAKDNLSRMKPECEIITDIKNEAEMKKKMDEYCREKTTQRERDLEGLHFVIDDKEELILPFKITPKYPYLRFTMYGDPILLQYTHGSSEVTITIKITKKEVQFFDSQKPLFSIEKDDIQPDVKITYDLVPVDDEKQFEIKLDKGSIVVKYINKNSPFEPILCTHKLLNTNPSEYITIRSHGVTKIKAMFIADKPVEFRPLKFSDIGIKVPIINDVGKYVREAYPSTRILGPPSPGAGYYWPGINNNDNDNNIKNNNNNKKKKNKKVNRYDVIEEDNSDDGSYSGGYESSDPKVVKGVKKIPGKTKKRGDKHDKIIEKSYSDTTDSESNKSDERKLPMCHDPYHCIERGNPAHMKKFRHVCEYNPHCKLMKDPTHMRMYIHPEVKKCPDMEKCDKLDDFEHRNNYDHGENFLTIPKVCKYGKRCRRIGELDHHKNVYHPHRSQGP